MEIGQRIKEHRNRAGLSQDDLSQRIYVSRQTVSSWENDKTYPDVQSLVLLSEVFGTSVDELVKGDVEIMEKIVEKVVDHDASTLKYLSIAIAASLLLAFASFAWLAVQVASDWDPEHTVPTAALMLTFVAVYSLAGLWANRIMKERDLVTYREIVAFSKGERVNRDTPHGRKKRRRANATPRWAKRILVIGAALAGALVGGFTGWNLTAILDALVGA